MGSWEAEMLFRRIGVDVVEPYLRPFFFDVDVTNGSAVAVADGVRRDHQRKRYHKYIMHHSLPLVRSYSRDQSGVALDE